jgi:ABC-type glycerol-3-phosphate transport system permease component
MAASLLVLAPNVVLFFFAQRQFLRGISLGAGR